MLTRAASRAARGELQQPAAVARIVTTTGAAAVTDTPQPTVQHDTDACEMFIQLISGECSEDLQLPAEAVQSRTEIAWRFRFYKFVFS